MKVLAINGSPRPLGNCSNVLNEVQDMFERDGIEMEILHIYEYRLTNCNVCLTCEIRGDGRCYDEDDGFNDILDRMRAADGILLASPTYMNACPSVMQTFLERAMLVFENGDLGLRGKVGGAFAVCGHDGASMVYNQLVDFMLRNGMLVVGANPLPIIRSLSSPGYEDDVKGMRGVRALEQGMADAIVRLSLERFRRSRNRSPLPWRCGRRPPSCPRARSSGGPSSCPLRAGPP